MFDPQAVLATMTTHPGVYRMFDADGKLLYVGKAKNLRKRVSNYFRASGLDTKTMALVGRIADIQLTVTRNESEALLLEQSLIQEHHPPYNIQFRDDKSYPGILLTDGDTYPRLAYHRGAPRRNATLFGPYPSGGAVRESLTILQKVFRVRQCEDSYFRNRSRPCLQYQIERCSGPCVGMISQEDYARDVNDARMFLLGKNDELLKELADRMDTAAATQHYEEAARLRDQIRDLRHVQERQVVSGQGDNVDVLAAATQGEMVCIHILMIRNGRLSGSRNYFPKGRLAEDLPEMLSAFVAGYYLQGNRQSSGQGAVADNKVPGELILYPAIQDRAALADALSQSVSSQGKTRKVKVSVSVRGHRARLQEMALTNAQQSLQSRISSRQHSRERFARLQEVLGLEKMPVRIECFDISHTQGESTVASCVVFGAEGAIKSDYRRFNISGVAAGDDYAAMHQALSRRYGRLSKAVAEYTGNDEDDDIRPVLPDILLIDGGKGQLTQAAKVLREFDLHEIHLLGIAKGISRRAGQETLYLADTSDMGDSVQDFALAQHDGALHLLQQIRDEAHRFAITGHRQQRAKTRKTSPLEEIPGLGPARRRQLLRFFGGQQEISRASVEQLAKVPGISKKLADDIYTRLHNG